MANKKYLTMTVKNKQIESEIAMIGGLADVDNDALHQVDSNHKVADSHENQSTSYKEEEDIVALEKEINNFTKDELEEHNFEFEYMFNKLGQGEKWYLSNGKYVDDKLFMFGLQRQPDHPSRSLSIDHYDENYTTYNVSTQQGLQKIITYQKKSLPMPSDSMKLFKQIQSRQYSQASNCSKG